MRNIGYKLLRRGEGIPRKKKVSGVLVLIYARLPLAPGVIDHTYIRISLKGFHDTGELAAKEKVIRIEKGDDLAVGVCDAEVQSRGLASIWFVEVFNSRAIFFDALGCVIGRAVVNDDNLDFIEREILREDAIDGLLEKLAVVVGRNEDGDQGCGHQILSRKSLLFGFSSVTYRGAISNVCQLVFDGFVPGSEYTGQTLAHVVEGDNSAGEHMGQKVVEIGHNV